MADATSGLGHERIASAARLGGAWGAVTPVTPLDLHRNGATNVACDDLFDLSRVFFSSYPWVGRT